MSKEITGKSVSYTSNPLQPPTLTPCAEAQAVLHSRRTYQPERYPSQAGKVGWMRPGLLGGPAGAIRREALQEKLLLVDAEVLDYFKESGDAAGEKMNAVLRDYAETHRKLPVSCVAGGNLK